MARPSLEVADILDAHGDAFIAHHRGPCQPRPAQGDVGDPRPAARQALGGQCRAATSAPTPPSPTTPAATGIVRSARALRRRIGSRIGEAELLPVPYYHVVFTLPARSRSIAFQNKAVVYDLLFKASAETLLTIAADPKHLGARIGLHRRAAHLGLGADPPPPCPYHRAGRRPVAGRQAAGSPASPASSCPCGSCRACSAGCSSTSSRRSTRPAA